MEAADASTSLWTPAVAIAVGATVAAVLLLGVALYQRWRLGALAARAVAADAARDELSVLLAGAPFGMCRWGPDGERRDAAFEALLAEGYRSVEEAIAARFGFEDAEIALARLTELREDGVAFDLNAGFLDGSGAVALYGRRTAGGQDVLWIRDCGGEAAERARLKREAASTRREADGFRDLLDALPLPVWRRRPDLSLEWCNAAFAAAVESGRDDVLAFGRELGAGRPAGRSAAGSPSRRAITSPSRARAGSSTSTRCRSATARPSPASPRT